MNGISVNLKKIEVTVIMLAIATRYTINSGKFMSSSKHLKFTQYHVNIYSLLLLL